MYSKTFCKIYDTFGWNYYPETFGELLLQWLNEQQITVRTAMDIGCGTGMLCHILQEAGIQAEGMDLSEDMVQLARKKYPDLKFTQANMITFCPDRTFDLVTSTCDAVNHVLDLADIERVLDHVYQYVSDGGWFIFDLLKSEEVASCDPVDLGETEDGRADFQIIRGEDDLVTLQLEYYKDDKLVFREQSHERIYPVEDVLQLVKNAGFREVTCRDRLLEHDSSAGTSWFIFARK